MKMRIETDDNGFTLLIPKSFADSIGFDLDSEVELTFVEGRLVITPAVEQKQEYRLEDLLQQINEDNMHEEQPL